MTKYINLFKNYSLVFIVSLHFLYTLVQCKIFYDLRGSDMKKILTTLAISLSALFACGISSAAPHGGDNNFGFDHKKSKMNKEQNFQSQNDSENFDRRRMREERGVKRLQEHKWQEGYVLPQHYRSKSYKVESQQSNLPRSSRNAQWYKINNDYILVDSDSNKILRILDH